MARPSKLPATHHAHDLNGVTIYQASRAKIDSVDRLTVQFDQYHFLRQLE